MKSLKAICPAAVLALALSVSAYAGDVETPGRPGPTHPICTTGNNCVPVAERPASSNISASDFTDILWSLMSIFLGQAA